MKIEKLTLTTLGATGMGQTSLIRFVVARTPVGRPSLGSATGFPLFVSQPNGVHTLRYDIDHVESVLLWWKGRLAGKGIFIQVGTHFDRVVDLLLHHVILFATASRSESHFQLFYKIFTIFLSFYGIHFLLKS